ncbi:hypothetical protein HDV57DRAFT_8375 [Trichoderma longibrachiatum]
MELFAIDSLTNQASTLFDSSKPEMPFILAHQDMRCSNIIVTEEFHINGIIDWEFSSTIPRHLFTRPLWITGHDLDAMLAYPVRVPITLTEICFEFRQVLETKSAIPDNCVQLMETWKHRSEQLFPVAQILRHPVSSAYATVFFFLGPWKSPRKMLLTSSSQVTGQGEVLRTRSVVGLSSRKVIRNI